ncbi:helix-turn-helix domain-containing protein [Clostridium sporogenes]|uniref:helix-turn-helix domain-containing protein n=1 Tax=Clostridium sporogenes TaxID=1509 RepID=UPI0013D352D2|nr:helix-turn-helix domain-containing protein [Clostridium sporogenes]
MDRWEQFNSIIDNNNLSSKGKLLLLVIFRYYNSQKKYSYPSKATIKSKCGFTTDRDYYKYVKELEKNNFLKKETIKGKGCKFYITHYQNDSDCQNDSNTHCQNDSNTHCQNDSNTHCQNDSNTHCQNDSTKRKEKKKENILSYDEVKKINITSTSTNNIYADIFDYWNSKGIINHKKFTPADKKAIDKAIKENSYTLEDIKKLIDRHKQVIEKTKNNNYPVRKRPFKVFFGQKIQGGTSLICTQYEDGGKFERYFSKNNIDYEEEFRPI